MAEEGAQADQYMMATPWRRRCMCIIDGGEPAPAALYAVSGRNAVIETSLRPPTGSVATLHHPEAGSISGEVIAHGEAGIELRFPLDEKSIAFALSAIVCEMSSPRGRATLPARP
ncbi:MAG: hypothetical protein ACFBQW_02880 [Sphingomonadaceae bacterium]